MKHGNYSNYSVPAYGRTGDATSLSNLLCFFHEHNCLLVVAIQKKDLMQKVSCRLQAVFAHKRVSCAAVKSNVLFSEARPQMRCARGDLCAHKAPPQRRSDIAESAGPRDVAPSSVARTTESAWGKQVPTSPPGATRRRSRSGTA